MSKPGDDLEAVRALVDTLQPFDTKDRERIIRWAREKLGMSAEQAASLPTPGATQSSQGGPTRTGAPRDIRTFIQEKNPRNERHLAAVVAYYYHFEAPPDQQKDSVTSQDLVDACRAANWTRPRNPAQTLINAFNSGYLE